MKQLSKNSGRNGEKLTLEMLARTETSTERFTAAAIRDAEDSLFTNPVPLIVNQVW
jgi:hypothetical protein